jgi:hypothetical protein
MRANGFPSVRASLQGRDAPSEQGNCTERPICFNQIFGGVSLSACESDLVGQALSPANASDFIRSLEFLHLEQVEAWFYQDMALAMAQIGN